MSCFLPSGEQPFWSALSTAGIISTFYPRSVHWDKKYEQACEEKIYENQRWYLFKNSMVEYKFWKTLLFYLFLLYFHLRIFPPLTFSVKFYSPQYLFLGIWFSSSCWLTLQNLNHCLQTPAHLELLIHVSAPSFTQALLHWNAQGQGTRRAEVCFSSPLDQPCAAQWELDAGHIVVWAETVNGDCSSRRWSD